MITELWEHTHLWRNDSRVPAQAIRHQRVSVICSNSPTLWQTCHLTKQPKGPQPKTAEAVSPYVRSLFWDCPDMASTAVMSMPLAVRMHSSVWRIFNERTCIENSTSLMRPSAAV